MQKQIIHNETPVSDPIANGVIPRATDEAAPADDPPINLSLSYGFLTIPVAAVVPVPPIANSSRVVFPIRVAPAFFNFLYTVASYTGM